MDEFTKGNRQYIRVRDEEYPYDAKVSVYIDTETGGWVVSTPMGTESTAELCAEMLEHFNEILDQQSKNGPPAKGVYLLPALNQEVH